MKTILYDIGGVLLKVNFDLAINRLNHESGLSKPELEKRIFSSGIKEKHDLGIISSEEFYRQIFPCEEVSFAFFQSAWGEIFTENLQMVDHLSSYAKSYRLYTASNTDPIHFAFFCRNFPWFSLFDGFGLSFNLKRAKPSPDFYTNLCKEFDLHYGETIFVDDDPDNVEAAGRLGITSHVYTTMADFQQFIEDL